MHCTMSWVFKYIKSNSRKNHLFDFFRHAKAAKPVANLHSRFTRVRNAGNVTVITPAQWPEGILLKISHTFENAGELHSSAHLNSRQDTSFSTEAYTGTHCSIDKDTELSGLYTAEYISTRR